MDLVMAAVMAVFLYMTAVFVLALIVRDNGIADVAWGLGFAVVAGVTLWQADALAPRLLLVTVLTFIWSIRLAAYILTRNVLREGEDVRYRAWREAWGRWVIPRSFVQVFMLQGALLLVVAAPLLVVGVAPGGPLGLLDAAGCALWTAGFLFEAVADAQLLRFKRDPAHAGRIMTRGLWRYTRHPNYFGEALLWWGMFVVALGSPLGLWAAVGPVTITVLLRRVSGVPMLEKKYAGHPEFEAYRARTNAFVPWFPQRGSGEAGEAS